MAKRLVRLIVISDFVSPRSTSRPCIPAYLFVSPPFPRHARGASSPNASFRTPSRNARTFLYRLRSNIGHFCSTVSVPLSPLIRTSLLGEKLAENDGRHVSSWLRNAAKPWASICESSSSYLVMFQPLLFEWPSPCVVQGACTGGPERADILAILPGPPPPHCLT
jgi:hypothetical protein